MKITLLSCLLLTCIHAFSQTGQFDPTFGIGGRTILPIPGVEQSGIVLQPDGKVVVGSKTSNGVFTVIRLNANGSVDPTFDGDGIVTVPVGTGYSAVYDVALQSDGKIVAVGRCQFGGSDFGVVRLNTDGSLDLTFDGDGIAITHVGTSNDYATGVEIQPDGKIVVGGTQGVIFGQFAAVRYNTDGSLDNSFSGDGIFVQLYVGPYSQNVVTSIALQADGKIVLGGYGTYNASFTEHDFGIVRINADGSIDLTFSGDGSAYFSNGQSDHVEDLAVQADGKIVAVGESFSPIHFKWEYAVLRVNSDGTLDNSFDGDGMVFTDLAGSHDKAFKVALQSDNKIIAAGYSERQDENSDTRYDVSMARYNTDGSLDITFANNGMMVGMTPTPDEVAYAMTLGVNRIYIAGWANNALAVDAYINNGSPLIVLPVKLTSFTASRAGDANLLSWLTASEQMLSHFEVERSADGRRYENIGTVQAAGNSNTPLRYNFTDSRPNNGINFYRLKMVDLDSKYSYSNVVILHPAKTNVRIFPNPASSELHMQLNRKGLTTYRILSMSGTVVKKGTVTLQGVTSLTLDVSELPAGKYFIEAGDVKEGFVIAR